MGYTLANCPVFWDHFTGDWPHSYKHQLYREQICPAASPALIETYADGHDLPRISCAGKRPGWIALSRHLGLPVSEARPLRFDTFSHALAAARSGLGVVPASLPLIQGDLDHGTLVRLADTALNHPESYWMVAETSAISFQQWKILRTILTGAAQTPDQHRGLDV